MSERHRDSAARLCSPSDSVGELPKRFKQESFWDDVDTQLMVMAAHNYCLGRQTYMAHACMDWLWKHRENFERNTLFIIVRDTARALRDGTAGSEKIDAPEWKTLANKLCREMRSEDRRLVKEQVQPWPLDA